MHTYKYIDSKHDKSLNTRLVLLKHLVYIK